MALRNIVSVGGNKGGSGKTTTSTTLASALANYGSVCLLDFDSQGHCCLSYGLDTNGGVYDWLSGVKTYLGSVIHGRPASLYIMGGDSRQRLLERKLDTREAAQRVQEMVRSIEADYIVIDTKSSGILQEIAISVANQVVIPFRLEQFGVEGAHTSLEMFKSLGSHDSYTLLPVGMDIRLAEHREKLQQVMADYPEGYGLSAESVVKSRVAVMRAQAEGETIWEYDAPELADVRRAYSLLVTRILGFSKMTQHVQS